MNSKRMLLYVVCTAGEFVWNEGGVVQVPAPYITLCHFLHGIYAWKVIKVTAESMPRLTIIFKEMSHN